jgi:hypothetical protein
MPSDTYILTIADAGVSTPADGSVTTVKILDANVTTAKIADANVTTAKLATGSVTDVKLATDSVIPAKIQAGAVTDVKLATSAVTTVKIADGAVTSAKIAATTITDGNIAAGAAIALSKLATGLLPAGITVATAAACTGNAATATTATNLSGATAFTIPYQTAASATGYIPVGTSGQVLQSNGAAQPTWVTVPVGTVAAGGTGITSYATGDILFASVTDVLSKLPAAAAGSVLLSGATPSYGKVILTTGSTQHVTGTLPVDKGGTGAATLTGYVKGAGTSALTAIATIPVADGGTGVTQSAYGEYYLSGTPAATPIVTNGQYVKVAGTTTEGTLSNFTHTSGNRLTYGTGMPTRKFFVSASVSFHGASGIDFAFAIGKNNNIVTASIVEQTGESANDLANISIQCIVQLAATEYIEVFATSITGPHNPTVDQMNVVAIALI